MLGENVRVRVRSDFKSSKKNIFDKANFFLFKIILNQLAKEIIHYFEFYDP